MGLFRGGRKKCPGGRWTTLISNFGTGMPKTFTIAFVSPGGQPVSGEFEEKKYTWIFPRRPVRGPLVPMMEFHREWINGIYRVRVRPDTDLLATFK